MSIFLKNLFKLLIVSLVIVLLLMFGFIYIKNSHVKSNQSNEDLSDAVITRAAEDERIFDEKIAKVNTIVSTQYDQAGKNIKESLRDSYIYLMLSNNGGVSTQSFVYNNGLITEQGSENVDDRYYSFSPDGSKFVFLALTKKFDDSGIRWNSQANVLVGDSSNLTTPFASLAQALDLGGAELQHKEYATVNNNGTVLIVGGEQPDHEPGEVAKAGYMSIYKISNGKAEFLINGFFPKWVNDEQFMFLRTDGLYIADADGQNMKLIAPASSDSPVRKNNRFDISHDGNMVAWTQPQHSKITIFRKNNEGAYVLDGVIPQRSFWVAFSPNDRHLAIQTIPSDLTGAEVEHDARLIFYDLDTLNVLPDIEIPLKDFHQLGMFMTDWVRIKK